MLERYLEYKLCGAAKTDPVVILHGARAVGKTTLAEQLIAKGIYNELRTFLDPNELLAAKTDPTRYINSLPHGTIIDEAQLAENITLPIKALIDKSPEPGKFMLTGSSRLKRNNLGGSDPLAGRAQPDFILHPLTITEINETKNIDTLSKLFHQKFDTLDTSSNNTRTDIEMISAGGLPGIYRIPQSEDRNLRFEQYYQKVLELPDFEQTDIRLITSLFRYLAGYTGGILNTDKFSRANELNRATVNKYLGILQDTMLITRLPAWSLTPSKTETSRPKLYCFDSGLATTLSKSVLSKPEEFGKLFETYAVNNIVAHCEWNRNYKPYHWRYRQNSEIDLIIQNRSGDIIAIEIKSSSSLTEDSFKHLKTFQKKYPTGFKAGYVLYNGAKILPFGKNLWAIPITIF